MSFRKKSDRNFFVGELEKGSQRMSSNLNFKEAVIIVQAKKNSPDERKCHNQNAAAAR